MAIETGNFKVKGAGWFPPYLVSIAMTICTAFLVAFTVLPLTAFAQATSVVPFVGCPSDGQVGPQPAPTAPKHEVRVPSKIAPQLSYYSTSDALSAVLAPRGWNCFGFYGSSGQYLFVTPEPLDRKANVSLSGAFVTVDYLFGYTSGRHRVAEVIARLFPVYGGLVRKWIERSNLPEDFRITPYKNDAVTPVNNRVARFTTAPNTVGLGAGHRIRPESEPVDGIAILVKEITADNIPDLLQVDVRLPGQLNSLKPHILRQAEIDARHLATH